MFLAHKIRLNPSPEQEIYFKKACGTARFTYNWALATWKQNRDNNHKKSVTKSKNDLNDIKREKYPWMYAVTKCAAEYAFIDLNQAMSNHSKTQNTLAFPIRKQKNALH